MVKVIRGERVGRLGNVRVSATAIILNTSGQKMLLTRRKDNGRWCLPGGYMKAGENIMEACVREIEEETGLRTQVKRLIGVYSSPDMVLEYADGHRYQVVNLCFEADIAGGETQISEETTELGFFSPKEIELMDVMEHHLDYIEDALTPRSDVFIE